MKRYTLLSALILFFLLLAQFTLTASASETMQLPQFATPTPGPDGRIIYVVQEGDTCIRISLLSGVPIDQLRALNRLDDNCILSVGQQLILGVGGPSGGTATPGPAATATPLLPTPTALPGAAKVCVLLYDDLNGNAIREETEITIESGAVSVTGASGEFSQTSNVTAGLDPVCFEEVPEGIYTISAAAPQGYNATTQQTAILDIKAGEEIYVGFGAQAISTTVAADPEEGSSSSMLGMIGGGMLLAGLGLAVYYYQFYGRKPKVKLAP